jgi:hypothetical protein
MSTYVLRQAMPIKALLLARALGVLMSIPPSSIVGAMLWAGYFGNVLVTHFI